MESEIKEMAETLKYLKEQSASQQKELEIIKLAILEIPKINEALIKLNLTFENLAKTIKEFFDFIKTNIKYPFIGIFIIILFAMGVGVKEIAGIIAK